MSLKLYCGPMWAGKSSTVLGTLRRYKSIGWNILLLTSEIDNRYGSGLVVSHDQEKYPALAVRELTPVLRTKIYEDAQLIMIDEAQFLPDLYDFVLKAVDVDQKHVICVGLDGDSDRKPFGDLLRLVPHCDSIEKITSFCCECKDGTPALFSFHRSHKFEQVEVGHTNQYEPLCRKHFNEKTYAKKKYEESRS
jgi:thymidine kinase